MHLSTRTLRLLSTLLLLLFMLSACSPALTAPAETSADSTDGTAGETDPANETVSLEFTFPAPAEVLEDFPLLIALNAEKYPEHASVFDAAEDASALTVTDENGTPLPLEVVSYSKSDRTAELWVTVPRYSADKDTVLTLSVGGETPAGTVFGDGYDLVLHANEIYGNDSSEKSNELRVFGNVQVTDGVFGNALLFDGESAYLTAGTPSEIIPESGYIINNPYTNTGYQKPTSWNHAQGLTTDGEYLYYAGHFDSANKGASIHKIRMSDMTEVGVFDHVGPMHSADMDYHPERGTLFVSSGGKYDAEVWEIDRNTGEVLIKWNLATVGYGVGAAVTLLGGMDILLTTGTDNGAKIAFNHITLDEGGIFRRNAEWHYDATDLGVPQGIESLSNSTDGTISIYYLADAGKSVSADPHYIYKIDLPKNGAATVSARYHISISEETEGIAFYTRADGLTDVYFGSNAERIYKLDKPLEQLSETPMEYISPNAFSLSCFVRLDGLDSQYPGILGFGSETNNKNRFSLHLFGDSEGKLRFGVCLDDVWTKLDTGENALPLDGKFHHVAAVYDGQEMRLYIDGIRICSVAVSGMLTDYGAPFSIGADIENGAPAFYFRGAIDELRLVRTVRRDAWIAAEAEQMQ